MKTSEPLASTQPGRERALLVGVDMGLRQAGKRKSGGHSPARRPAAAMARAAREPDLDPDSDPESDPDLATSANQSSGDDSADSFTLTGFDAEASLAEFRELVESAGAVVVDALLQRRQRPDPATLIGTGKIEEISAIAAANEVDLVLFDHDLTPTQLRNLERLMPCRVLDRTQLILDIFARHARTREGQLQVELAQLEYMLPRLAGRGKAMSQLGGGIGTRGPGETKLETDRRLIQRRLVHLREQIESVRRVRRQQRQRREAAPIATVALVGYTNAGKSTLFNQLTGAGVLASSRMFATLDPKLRHIELPSRRRILLSDTVGFIRNLPHTLVTSFRATLEEVERAEVLLHVRDAASSYAEEQRQQVESVLGELDVLDKTRIEVLNKADLLSAEQRQNLTPEVTLVSGLTGEGIDALLEAIDNALTRDPLIEAELTIPQADGAILAAIEAGAAILARGYSDDNVLLTVRGPTSLIARVRRISPGGEESLSVGDPEHAPTADARADSIAHGAGKAEIPVGSK